MAKVYAKWRVPAHVLYGQLSKGLASGVSDFQSSGWGTANEMNRCIVSAQNKFGQPGIKSCQNLALFFLFAIKITKKMSILFYHMTPDQKVT